MINTYKESSLHKTIKILYSQEENGKTEVEADGHIYDILTKEGNVIEIQTQNLSKLLSKSLDAINHERKVKVVYPLSMKKHIILQDENGTVLSNRVSPKKGTLFSVFRELTGLYPVLLEKNFTLEILFIESSELRLKKDHKVQTENGRRRFLRDWIKTDKKLIEITEKRIFKGKKDWLSLLPFNNDEEFTVKDLTLKIRELYSAQDSKYSSLMIWVFNKMNLVTQTGIKGKARIYRINNE